MKRRYILQIGAGFLLAAAGILLPITGTLTDTAASSALISVGTVMITFGVLNHRRFGDEIETDERTRKIGGEAASWSWFATLILLCIIFWANKLGGFTPDIEGVILGTILFMALTGAAFSWYFARREVGE